MTGYEELVQHMEQEYAAQTGMLPDEASDTGVRFRVLAGEIYNLLTGVEWLKQSLVPQTATGKQLDYLAQEHGLERRPETHAQGVVRFTSKGSNLFPITLPTGTRCCTNGQPAVYVELLEGTEVPIAAGAVVDAKAQAVESGPGGNLPAGAVVKLAESNDGIRAVTNFAAFTGGRSAETDEKLRVRLMERGRMQSNGGNVAFYRELALQQTGVTSVSVQPITPGKGEVTLWLAAEGAPASDEAVQAVQEKLEQMRELNVSVHVFPAKTIPVKISVTVQPREGQDKSAVQSAAQKAIADSFLTLEVGQAVTQAGLCSAVYHTGMVSEVTIPQNLTFPAAAADTLPVLDGQAVVMQ
jgi:uncharacterized phage protein gp47/JayE